MPDTPITCSMVEVIPRSSTALLPLGENCRHFFSGERKQHNVAKMKLLRNKLECNSPQQ